MASLVSDLPSILDNSWLSKQSIATTVTEVTESKSDTFSPVHSDVEARIDTQHEWHHFPTERNIQHQHGDTEKLSEAIAWTEAFVDRLALLTVQAKGYNYLKLKEDLAAATKMAEIEKKRAEGLAKEKKELKDTLAKAKAKDQQDIEAVQHQLMEAKAYIKKLEQDKKEQENALAKAKEKDQKDIEAVQHQLMEAKAYIEKLEKALHDAPTAGKAEAGDIKAVQHQLMEAKAFIEKLEKDHEDERKTHAKEVKDLKEQLEQANDDVKKVQHLLMEAKAYVKKVEEDREDERKTHSTEVAKLKEQLKKADEDVKKVQHLLMEAKAYSAELKEDNDKIKKELNSARDLAERTQKINDQTAADLLTHLRTYDKGAIPPHPKFDKSSIRIISVVYGGHECTWTDENQVFINLYNAAASKDKSFHVNDQVFNTKASLDKGKGCVVTYQVVKGGLVNTIVGTEGSILKFKDILAY